MTEVAADPAPELRDEIAPINPWVYAVGGLLFGRGRGLRPRTCGYFSQVRVAGTLANPDGIHNIEAGGHVCIRTGPRQPWGRLWPQPRHYD